MIFGKIDAESVVQVGDMVRLNLSRSFTTPEEGEVTQVEIQPEAGGAFFCVSPSDKNLWFIDWAYSTAGVKTVTGRIATDGEPVDFSHAITVITAAQDNLLSQDSDISAHETDILKYLPAGKNSFIYVHRRSQRLILDYLNQMGYRHKDGTLLTQASLIQTEDFRLWSTYLTLHLIFRDLSNAVDDIFAQKALAYEQHMLRVRDRAYIPFDRDKDGTLSTDEQSIRFSSIRVRRD